MPTYVLTGASSGLGRAAALALSRRADRIIVGARDVERTRAVLAAAGPAVVDVRRVDLADLADVRRFAAELAAGPPIDALVCNAGVQVIRGLNRTVDGHEETFAVNHLAHFVLALGALPALAPGARVVFVGSGTHHPSELGGRVFGFRGGRYTSAAELAEGSGDPAVSEIQRGNDRYATSKLCNLLTMAELARRIPPARAGVFAIDPGLMPGTGLARDRGLAARVAWRTLLPVVAPLVPGVSSARRSGAALAWLAADPALAGRTGVYVDYRRREIEPWEGARRADWADDLFRGSVALAGLDPASVPG